MIVQCGTTTTVMHAFGEKHSSYRNCKFLAEGPVGGKVGQLWPGKAELFIRSWGTVRSAVVSLWLAYKTITSHK